MLIRVCTLLLVAAAICLLVASDVVLWHIAPKAFDIAEFFAFNAGIALSFLALVLSLVSLRSKDRRKAAFYVCGWSAAEFFGFCWLYVVYMFSA